MADVYTDAECREWWEERKGRFMGPTYRNEPLNLGLHHGVMVETDLLPLIRRMMHTEERCRRLVDQTRKLSAKVENRDRTIAGMRLQVQRAQKSMGDKYPQARRRAAT